MPMFSIGYSSVKQEGNNFFMLPMGKRRTVINNPANTTSNTVSPSVPRYRHGLASNLNSNSNLSQTQTDANKPKMIWGKHIWFFFHTIAEKIKEEQFLVLRHELLNIIFSVCSNLPCPTCAEHAKEYIKQNNFMAIQTKDELKRALFVFHNTVNQRKKYPLFTWEELNTLYPKAVLPQMIHNFLIFFNMKSKSIRLVADEVHRQNLSKSIRMWFQNHMDSFDGPVIPSI